MDATSSGDRTTRWREQQGVGSNEMSWVAHSPCSDTAPGVAIFPAYARFDTAPGVAILLVLLFSLF